MDKLIEFVPQIFSNFAALLFPNLGENKEVLEGNIELLESRKEDVQESRDAQIVSGKKRKREVEEWLKNVENIIKDSNTLVEQVQQGSRFYHVFKRQKLAGQLKRMNEEVTRLDNQRNGFPTSFSLEVDESVPQLSLIPNPNGQGFLQNLDDIWTLLMDDRTLRIGIYGMGGVGKTTLARCAHDKLLKEESAFSRHVWVTVSQEFSIYKLQSDVAQELGLDFTRENDVGKRAAKLLHAFKNTERFVLILDDVWKQIDACAIGIPSERGGFKLLITSRSEKVCKQMDCEEIIKVNTLPMQESWDLFSKILDSGELHSEVKHICEKMVDKCGGLPLALKTLAGSMKGVIDICEWRDACESLSESCTGSSDFEDKVLPILRHSYDRLREEKLKNCFLYCSLYPEDELISRDKLIGKFILEELMEGRSSLQSEIDQGHAILNKLVRVCLLERGYGYVKMHDLIRKMAIGVTKDNPRYMVKAGPHLKELPEEQEWTEDLDKVSLMCNSIREISPGTSPKCPRLSTLILKQSINGLIGDLRWIPGCFFTQMCGLRTLDLSFTRIQCLPNSISDLEKLNALLLHCCCELTSVPSLEKLKQLRHLDLTRTGIKEVPHGMESLTKLKCLHLVCYWLEMIPTGTLHRLTHLQQLNLPRRLEVPVEEVEALKQLEVFQGRLGSIYDLKRLIMSRQSDEQLFSYDIALGSPEGFYEDTDVLPCKQVHLGKGSVLESSLDTDENLLPRNIETLCFSRSGLSSCLLDEFPILNYARDLKRCKIEKEDKMESILRLPLSTNEDQQSTGVPFQSLKKLELEDLPNFVGLFKWEAVAPLPPGLFSCLKELHIRGCDKIKKLFPQNSVNNFHNLKKLTVQNCVQMEEIIEDYNNEGADITLPRLQELYLFNLPQLKNICKVKMTPSSSNEQQQSSGVPFQSLVTLELEYLPNFIGLFKWEAIAPLPPGLFSCLKELSIEGCDKIKKLFPQNSVNNFHNLQELTVEDCVQMEEIIEDYNNEGADITLPRLQALSLGDLPQLKSICRGKMICDSIEYISLKGIKNIKKFPLHLPLLHGQLSSPPYLTQILLTKEEEEWWKSLEWGHHNANNVLEHLVEYYQRFLTLYPTHVGSEGS